MELALCLASRAVPLQEEGIPMSEVHTPPTASIPDAWANVDTTIDTEPPDIPETLSPHQFDRHIAAVAHLLTAAGLDATTTENRDGHAELHVTNPALGYHNTLHLTLRDDRSAEWTLEAFDDDLEEAPTTQIAAHILAIVNTPTPADN